MLKKVVLLTCASILCRADDITPRVGAIEVFGNRKISAKKILAAVGAREGNPPPSPEAAEDRIDEIPGVLASRVEATCCNAHKITLYVGIEERDSPRIEFHPQPTAELKLPAEIVDAYQSFLDAVAGNFRDDLHDQDLTHGYSLFEGPEANNVQHRFLELAARDLGFLDQVIRTSAYPEQRTIAAYVLQYAPRGPRTTDIMVNALQYALQDSEDSVRQNAMRALKAVAVGARLHPEQNIRLEPTWFIELLNSPVWSDRYNASLALVDLTERRNPDTLALLRERALPSLIEMAKWKDLRHALPAFILTGRVAGLSEDQIKQAWVQEDREAVIAQALSPKRKFHFTGKSKT